MVIERPGRERVRWVRHWTAAAAAFGVLAGGAAMWEYGRRSGVATWDIGTVAFVATGLHLAGTHWARKRPRRADLRWRPALVVRGGVRPGLQARRSRLVQTIEAVGVAALMGGASAYAGAEVRANDGWRGAILSTIGAVATVLSAATVFRRLRLSPGLAVTAGGVVVNGRVLPWGKITSVDRDPEDWGLCLRLLGRPDVAAIGDADSTVADERVAEVIEFYLANPHRRPALETGPDRLVLPPREPS